MSLAELLIRTIYGRQDPAPPPPRPPAVSDAPKAPAPAPVPQPARPEPAQARTEPSGGLIRALTSGRISDLCNTGGHYECRTCRCGCHRPLTNRST